MEKAPAIAYLRTDISEIRRRWDETRMRGLSQRLGYDLCRVVALSAASRDRIDRLLDHIAMENAEAVFVPHLAHLDGEHVRVVARADVIVDAEEVYARWPSIAFLDSAMRRPEDWREDHHPGHHPGPLPSPRSRHGFRIETAGREVGGGHAAAVSTAAGSDGPDPRSTRHEPVNSPQADRGRVRPHLRVVPSPVPSPTQSSVGADRDPLLGGHLYSPR